MTFRSWLFVAAFASVVSPVVAQTTPDQIETRNRAMINPSVQVKADKDFGSGTAIRVRRDDGSTEIVILTNHHVIETLLKKKKSDKDKKKPNVVELRGWLTENGKTYPVVYEGELAGWDADLDLGMIRVRGDWLGPVASVADSTLRLIPGETVFVTGAPLGLRVNATPGALIDPASYAYDDHRRIITTASTHPGNSGGSLWIERDGRFLLVGIPSAVAAKGLRAYTNISLSIPLVDVERFLRNHRLKIDK
jgi:S1-C subfamily serine protease